MGWYCPVMPSGELVWVMFHAEASRQRQLAILSIWSQSSRLFRIHESRCGCGMYLDSCARKSSMMLIFIQLS